jgi:hypothetical protein
MFSHGRQFDTSVVEATLWSGSGIDRGLQRFVNPVAGNVRLIYLSNERTRDKTPIKIAGIQSQISTKENMRDETRYPVIKFFDCHIRLSEGLNNLVKQNISGHFSYGNIYDPISNIISEYDQNLAHLPDHVSDIFFDYTDLLEGVLLVSKRRNIAVTDINDILIKLGNCYFKIYSLMKSSNHNDTTSIAEELAHLKEEIGNRELLPTVEECEQEMEETFESMNDKEKDDLARLLRKD